MYNHYNIITQIRINKANKKERFEKVCLHTDKLKGSIFAKIFYKNNFYLAHVGQLNSLNYNYIIKKEKDNKEKDNKKDFNFDSQSTEFEMQKSINQDNVYYIGKSDFVKFSDYKCEITSDVYEELLVILNDNLNKYYKENFNISDLITLKQFEKNKENAFIVKLDKSLSYYVADNNICKYLKISLDMPQTEVINSIEIIELFEMSNNINNTIIGYLPSDF